MRSDIILAACGLAFAWRRAIVKPQAANPRHPMVGGALLAIFFVLTLVAWTMYTAFYVIVAAHYFLTTLTDSSSGRAEVEYPRETIFDWWLKPILCAWALFIWVVPVAMFLSPLIFLSPTGFAITWLLALWLLYPLSLASILYSQHWLHFMHMEVLGRMLRHFPAFVYVNVITFVMCAANLWLIGMGLAGEVSMLFPAVLLVPATILLYARHWGRFSWLSLNFLPRYWWRKPTKKPKPEDPRAEWPEEYGGEINVEEADVPTDGVRAGLPPMHGALSTSITAGLPATPEGVVAGPPPASAQPAPDEFTYDPNPYKILDEPGLPTFAETAPAPIPMPAAMAAAPMAAVEEEDEWATDKKPYNVGDPVAPLPSADAPLDGDTQAEPDPNKPITFSKYYDDRAKKEAEDKRRAEKEKNEMPPLSKKTPTFNAALIAGVWNFAAYPSTIMAWANLAVFTFVELFLLWMLVKFSPFK